MAAIEVAIDRVGEQLTLRSMVYPDYPKSVPTPWDVAAATVAAASDMVGKDLADAWAANRELCDFIDAQAAELVSLRGQLANVRELAEAALVAQSFPVRQCWAEFVAINVAAGAPDPRCGATDGVHVCTQIAGHHSPDDYHDDGAYAFFAAGSERAS
jgi:hypothetical protein